MVIIVKLSFKIVSFYFEQPSDSQKHKTYNVTNDFDENLTLKDVVLSLKAKYETKSAINNYYIPDFTELLWQQYFSGDLCYYISISEEKYYNLSLKDLSSQFNISNIIITLWLNKDGIGKAIGVKEGVKIYFNSNERDLHHNPHVHCEYSGKKVRIEIDPIKVLDSPFKKSKMDIAISIIKEHKTELIEYWNRTIINGEPIELEIEI